MPSFAILFPTAGPKQANLMAADGAALVSAEWRYADTKIVEVDFTGRVG